VKQLFGFSLHNKWGW